MTVRTMMPIVLLLALPALCAGCGRRATEPAGTGGLALYLLARDVPTARLASVPLDGLALRDSPLLAGDDIVAYDRLTHDIELSGAAYRRVQALFAAPVPVRGLPFVVCVGREPLYAGAFWTSLSSQSFDGPVIMEPLAAGLPVIRITTGYPGPAFFRGPDPRADARIVAALRAAGKLLPAGASQATLDIFSGRPNPAWELSPAETEALAELIAGLAPAAPANLPTPLGYRGFVVSRPGAGGLTVTVTAYDGLVRVEGGGDLYYADPERSVERWLLDRARSHLDAATLAVVEEEVKR